MGLQVYNKAIRYLVVLTMLCVGMQLLRMYDTKTVTYIGLSWNLFLAWVPLIAAMAMVEARRIWVLTGLMAFWLLFFPNSPYLITDLIHLGPSPDYPHWYDAMLMYSFAFTGLMTGTLSTLIVYSKLRAFFDVNISRIMIMLCMYAAGFGVYVGRFLRWNSWDIAIRPMHLVNTIANHILHPGEYQLAYGVTLLSGSLLFAIFLFFDAIVQLPQVHVPPAPPIVEAAEKEDIAKPQPRNRDVNQDIAQHSMV